MGSELVSNTLVNFLPPQVGRYRGPPPGTAYGTATAEGGRGRDMDRGSFTSSSPSPSSSSSSSSSWLRPGLIMGLLVIVGIAWYNYFLSKSDDSKRKRPPLSEDAAARLAATLRSEIDKTKNVTLSVPTRLQWTAIAISHMELARKLFTDDTEFQAILKMDAKEVLNGLDLNKTLLENQIRQQLQQMPTSSEAGEERGPEHKTPTTEVLTPTPSRGPPSSMTRYPAATTAVGDPSSTPYSATRASRRGGGGSGVPSEASSGISRRPASGPPTPSEAHVRRSPPPSNPGASWVM